MNISKRYPLLRSCSANHLQAETIERLEFWYTPWLEFVIFENPISNFKQSNPGSTIHWSNHIKIFGGWCVIIDPETEFDQVMRLGPAVPNGEWKMTWTDSPKGPEFESSLYFRLPWSVRNRAGGLPIVIKQLPWIHYVQRIQHRMSRDHHLEKIVFYWTNVKDVLIIRWSVCSCLFSFLKMIQIGYLDNFNWSCNCKAPFECFSKDQ